MFYFWAALSDPGFLVNSTSESLEKPHHKIQSSSIASKATVASAKKQINPSANTTALQHQIQLHSCDNSRSERINLSGNSEESFSQQFHQLSEGSIPNLNFADNLSKIIISKPIPYKPEPASPLIYSQEDGDLSNREGSLKKPDFYVLFCIICHINQPMRAKHCNQCGKCVAMFDHHCPFLGTCVGEKNRLIFFWYVFFQALECWSGLAVCVGAMGERTEDWDAWVRNNAQYIVLGSVAFILALLISILWLYHLNLACRNVTTWENLRWDKITYLEGHKSSPFSKGLAHNILYYCKFHRTITDWQKV